MDASSKRKSVGVFTRLGVEGEKERSQQSWATRRETRCNATAEKKNEKRGREMMCLQRKRKADLRSFLCVRNGRLTSSCMWP